jgi:hypothetical protein
VGRLRVRIATAVALLSAIAALSAPAPASAFSKAIWGPAFVNGVNQFPIYKTLGVGIVEADLNWYQVAPQRPKQPDNPQDSAYHWPKSVQQIVSQAKRYHMRVLLQIIGSPRWSNGGKPWNWAPRPADYATFAAAAARHYPSVHLWMVWGEPSRRPNWEPETPAKPGQPLDAAQKVAPHRYAQVLDAAYGALKAVSTHNLVIGGSTYTTGDIDTQQWIENLRLPDGRPPRMDIYAHNPFSWRPPSFSIGASPMGEVQFADLPRLAGWIDRYLHRRLPIFLSEWTIPTQADQEFNFFVDPSVAAQWVTDALALSRQWSRIYGLGWVHVYDDPPVSYGGLMTVSGVPKPVFSAFQHG